MAVPKIDSELDEARERLVKFMPKGSTVFTILRHVSRSGMQREIGLVVLTEGQMGRAEPLHPNWAAGTLLGRRVNKEGDGIVCGGAGMDMGFELVYSLAQKLYGDGYALNHRWL